jgi:flagellin-like protein
MQIPVSYKLNTKYIFSIHIIGMRKMSIRKMLNSKKAISPILATLLLIVIAVAAIVVTYAWITTYMGTATQQAGVLPYKANVNFDNSTGTETIIIDIGNSGTSNGQVVQVYIGTSATATQSQTTDPVVPISLAAGAITSFNVTYTWSAGETYYFKVVPNSGAALTFQEQAPQ